MDQYTSRLPPPQMKSSFQIGYKDEFFSMYFFTISPAGTGRIQYFPTGPCCTRAGSLVAQGPLKGHWRMSLSSANIPSATRRSQACPACLPQLGCAVQVTDRGQRKEPLGNGFAWWQTSPGNVTSRKGETLKPVSLPAVQDGGKGGAVHKKEGCGMKRLGTFSKLGKNHSVYVKFE